MPDAETRPEPATPTRRGRSAAKKPQTTAQTTAHDEQQDRVHEAYAALGRMGGESVRKKYGPEFYSRIGKKGGDRVKAKYGPEFYSEIGGKGGETRREQLGHEGYQQLGHRGGETVRKRYGAEFYSEIGKRGGEKGGEARKAQMARGEIVRDDQQPD